MRVKIPEAKLGVALLYRADYLSFMETQNTVGEAPKKQIMIRCLGHSSAELDAFQDFQGDLKSLGKTEFEQLRNEILNRGFSFPLSVWIHEGTAHLLDGHQRVRVLKRLREEGYEVPPIPFDAIEADSYSEAKGKLLAATSQYGKITEKGLGEFIQSAQLVNEPLTSRFSLPGVNLGKVIDGLRGATPDEGDLGAGTQVRSDDPKVEKLPASHVRMVQLFFNEATHMEFLDLSARLDQYYGKGNMTDTVLEALRADFAAKFPNG